jgi:hypothetical protein
VFFDQFSARYEELRADPSAWGEIEAERAAESGTVLDRGVTQGLAVSALTAWTSSTPSSPSKSIGFRV